MSSKAASSSAPKAAAVTGESIFVNTHLFIIELLSDQDRLVAYLRETDPAVIVPIVVFLLTLVFSSSKGRSISFGDRLVGWWLLFNGILIHLFLDGMVGFLKRMPSLYEEYGRLDRRYLERDPFVMVISLCELVVYTPLCLWAYRALHRNDALTHPLIILISAIQWTGTWVFAGAEIFADFPNIPADLNLEFKSHHIIHFWVLFVAANALWTFLPMYLIYRSSAAIAKRLREADKLAKDK
ncbi:hypothetical protein CAOG_04277 [Capsaspora owczarzaki ATCC 30864]|uniref:EXPERA domain-containing protein n=1 Tax=Capsaspora owczarzaki (strain ATCC 30864) TaxID=595528 RepID=A0A0D2UEE1_CAPO3|nr:hypothetical protein CAOG_04277 [Capsaspora owczarzaki ATCC 30864]KJE93491.1 hypothetical protein CAOG_004277 [Capsaspora owczarzaki ATCC 30864]|eukprot:XP_004348102.1 hypothetical protein CAOG_04277 [Capsaspora owczarzaki ATCC 30864]